jgi:hypothetical protein
VTRNRGADRERTSPDMRSAVVILGSYRLCSWVAANIRLPSTMAKRNLRRFAYALQLWRDF